MGIHFYKPYSVRTNTKISWFLCIRIYEILYDGDVLFKLFNKETADIFVNGLNGAWNLGNLYGIDDLKISVKE